MVVRLFGIARMVLDLFTNLFRQIIHMIVGAATGNLCTTTTACFSLTEHFEFHGASLLIMTLPVNPGLTKARGVPLRNWIISRCFYLLFPTTTHLITCDKGDNQQFMIVCRLRQTALAEEIGNKNRAASTIIMAPEAFSPNERLINAETLFAFLSGISSLPLYIYWKCWRKGDLGP
jgi:hypothetical protein